MSGDRSDRYAGKQFIYCYNGETRDSHKRTTITKSGMGRRLERKRTRSVARTSQVFVFPLVRVDGPALSASVASRYERVVEADKGELLS